MNDPNGLVYAAGRHHLYYQYNPAGTAFANQHWGYATSSDLLTWTEHPVALAPGPGAYDATACFSGCAVPGPDGGVSFLYTGVGGGRSLPCLAHADGDRLGTLRKDPANPVIPFPPDPDVTAFRDHTAWRADGRWWQVVGGGRAARGGTLFAYSSDDLRTWTYQGVFTDRRSTGVPGEVWECPDHMTLAGGSALVISVIHDAGPVAPEVWWLTGRADGGRFEVTASGVGDLGDRFYAPQSYPLPDGRRIQIGWLRTHQDPAGRDGPAMGAMSLPRELSVRDGRLASTPAAELSGLRRAATRRPVTGPATEIPLDTPRIAGELVLDGRAADGLRSVTLRGPDGGMEVDLSEFAAGDGELRLFWDAGIVEVFRDGRAGAWSDLRVAEVEALTLRGGPTTAGRAEVWRLARAGRRPAPAG
jgi:beta-fructofuranosidase